MGTLMERLKNMRDDTLLRSMEQMGGGAASDRPERLPGRGVPASQRMISGNGSPNPIPLYGSTGPLDYLKGEGYDLIRSLFGYDSLRPDPSQRTLPNQENVLDKDVMTPPVSVDGVGKVTVNPASGGLGGLSVQDFANAHGKEVGAGGSSPNINDMATDRINAAVNAKQAAETKNTVTDFLKGMGASEEKRASSSYNPNFAGIKGFARDVAKGFEAIPAGEKARAAAALETKLKLDKASTEERRAKAAETTAAAAMKSADNALEKLYQEDEHFAIETSQKERQQIRELIGDIVASQAYPGYPIPEEKLKKFIQVAIDTVADLEDNKVLKDIGTKGAKGTVGHNAGKIVRSALEGDPTITTQAPSSTKTSKTVEELYKSLGK